MRVAFVYVAVAVLLYSNLVNCYDCDKENSEEGVKESLVGWTPKTKSEYSELLRQPKIRGFTIEGALASMDNETGVIDNKCYLIPRALEQIHIMSGDDKSKISTVLKKCYKEIASRNGNPDFHPYYICIRKSGYTYMPHNHYNHGDFSMQ